MPKSESPETSGERKRALLLLSLILLIWNIGASGSRMHALGPDPSSGAGQAVRTARTPSADLPASETAESPLGAPLSLKQKYLLGKRIDINMATLEEISELPGISDRVAASIVEERARRGRFGAYEDLLRVKGIKGKRLQKILPFLEKMQNN